MDIGGDNHWAFSTDSGPEKGNMNLGVDANRYTIVEEPLGLPIHRFASLDSE